MSKNSEFVKREFDRKEDRKFKNSLISILTDIRDLLKKLVEKE